MPLRARTRAKGRLHACLSRSILTAVSATDSAVAPACRPAMSLNSAGLFTVSGKRRTLSGWAPGQLQHLTCSSRWIVSRCRAWCRAVMCKPAGRFGMVLQASRCPVRRSVTTRTTPKPPRPSSSPTTYRWWNVRGRSSVTSESGREDATQASIREDVGIAARPAVVSEARAPSTAKLQRLTRCSGPQARSWLEYRKDMRLRCHCRTGPEPLASAGIYGLSVIPERIYQACLENRETVQEQVAGASI